MTTDTTDRPHPDFDTPPAHGTARPIPVWASRFAALCILLAAPLSAPPATSQTAPLAVPLAAPQSAPQAAPQSAPQTAPLAAPQAGPQTAPQAAFQATPETVSQATPAPARMQDGPPVTLDGFLVQGGMVWGRTRPGTRMTLDGTPVKVGADGHFVFGFGRDAGPEARLALTYPDGRQTVRRLGVASRRFDIERIDGLPPKTVTPPPEWRERRKRETGRVISARAPVTDATDWADGFILPAEGRFSGFYGSQRILNGKPRSPHYGIDIANSTGTPIVAPAGGIVRLAAPDFLLEGGIVIIDHGFGVTSTLFHMNTVDVAEGDRVAKGERIGTIGATGRASGPHVDWRINWGRVRLDPGLFFSAGTGVAGGAKPATDTGAPDTRR